MRLELTHSWIFLAYHLHLMLLYNSLLLVDWCIQVPLNFLLILPILPNSLQTTCPVQFLPMSSVSASRRNLNASTFRWIVNIQHSASAWLKWEAWILERPLIAHLIIAVVECDSLFGPEQYLRIKCRTEQDCSLICWWKIENWFGNDLINIKVEVRYVYILGILICVCFF